MYKSKKVSVVIPTYNEAGSIRQVIEEFFATNMVDEVIVVDNNAKVPTQDEVAKTKARRVVETCQGYGHALMKGLSEATGDLIVMVEADGTFQAKDVEKLLAYSDEFDAVLGTRTSRAAIYSGAFMPFLVRFGNWLWAKMIEIFWNGPVLTDVGCTYKLINRKTLEAIKARFVESKGDGTFSPELMIWLLEAGVKIIEVPVIYKERIGVSGYTGSIGKAFRLGLTMIPMIVVYRLRTYHTRAREIVVCAGSLLVACIVHLFGTAQFANDDQFIFYRYAYNLSHGLGFVYNKGEHVLGSTAPLYTLIVSFFGFMFHTVSIIEVTAWINIILFALAAVFFYRVCARLMSGNVPLLAAAIFIFALALAIPEAMETSLFILISFALVDALLAERFTWSAILVALACMVRPDAGLIAILAFVYWYMYRGKQAIGWVGVAVLTLLPWLIFATAYFGSPIPESLIAKSHLKYAVIESKIQAAKFILAHASTIYWGAFWNPDNIVLQSIFNLLPVLVLFGIAVWKRGNKKNWIIFAVPIVYLAAYGIFNPVMFAWYGTQMEPWWIITTMVGVEWVYRKISGNLLGVRKKLFMIACVVIILAGPICTYGYALNAGVSSKVTLYDAAQFLRAHMESGQTVGLSNIGIVGYYTQAHIIDFIGLVTTSSPAYYPITDGCRGNALYVVPPQLIMDTHPDWIVAGTDEIESCFKASTWWQEHYIDAYDQPGENIWMRRP